MRQLSETTWVEEGPTNIGFIVRNDKVLLVDSGNDKESGRKINKILKEKNWTLEAIVNTHSNADHIGGNDYLQRNLNCEIYASALEDSFIKYPKLETALLWGGLEVKDLRNKFFKAKPSAVSRLISDGDRLKDDVEIIGLKGHFMNMIGVKSPDDVIFLADSLFGKETLQKHKIPFIFDVDEYKKTLARIEAMEAEAFVPSHGSVKEDISDLVRFNLQTVEEIEAEILKSLKREKAFEEVLKDLCDIYHIELNAAYYALVGSTVKSFLTYLNDKEKVDYDFRENRMLWKNSADF